jgi:segregation and condensation protein A
VTVAADLDLDLDLFSGPFDLLLTLILREEVDLLELDLAGVVLAYLDHIEARGELDLESATEFILLVAALLELKSRLILPGEEVEDLLGLGPEEAAAELLERLLSVRRFRAAAEYLQSMLHDEAGVRFRGAPVPRRLRRASIDASAGTGDPTSLAAALGDLLRMPPVINLRHLAHPRVTVAERLQCLRTLLRRGTFNFDDAVQGADRMTVAVTLFALLELYRRGEADWEQAEAFGEITVRRPQIEPVASTWTAAARPVEAA